MDITQVKSVAIIGAGVAGLACARELLKRKIKCVIFERHANVGGVWSDGYLNFGVQVQKELYEFPGWPLPKEVPNFTPGPIMQNYISDFANHFSILPHIRFNTTVTHIDERKEPGSGWVISTICNGQENQNEFDLVVICIGLYSNIPNIPEFPNQTSFAGNIIHNSKLKSPAQFSGKRVAIVGYGKSATDAAIESAQSAEQTHIIFRQPHWPIPQKLAGIPLLSHSLK